MKFLIALSIFFSLSVQAYENPTVFCSINNEKLTKLSCSGGWTKMSSYPEVRIKMKECFGFKSTERLTVETDGYSETYNSVIFPFAVRQNGYTIRCARDDF